MNRKFFRWGWPLLLILVGSGCAVRDIRWTPPAPASDPRWQKTTMVTTGYCPCGQCCNWRHSWWFGRPVVTAGPDRGRYKEVGVTASGRPARPGTVAADAKVLPFDTHVYIPGYGYGIVMDRGGDITGYRLDLFFKTHREALAWGRRQLVIRMLLPERRQPR
ncbi:MAG: 3D domain-containing protein [Kiritimatiellaeota bacterium]|nr:3D domain-containing protein [Kiritimatiellota bacterium]